MIFIIILFFISITSPPPASEGLSVKEQSLPSSSSLFPYLSLPRQVFVAVGSVGCCGFFVCVGCAIVWAVVDVVGCCGFVVGVMVLVVVVLLLLLVFLLCWLLLLILLVVVLLFLVVVLFWLIVGF